MKQEDKLYLVESFFSIQGEGKYAGKPSIFLRFGGCNLNCIGFNTKVFSPKDGSILVGCDSIRATNKEHFKDLWQEVNHQNFLIEEVKKYIKKSCKPDIVLTGGEPLLYYKHPYILYMLNYFINKDFNITIETNATIKIDFFSFPIYKKIIFAMSVKLSNSAESYLKRVNKEAIKEIAKNAPKSFFKFVIDKSIKDNKEILDITKDTNLDIFCMPKGSTSKELSKNDKYVASFCIKYCYYYVDRMHIRLWDNEEGK